MTAFVHCDRCGAKAEWFADVDGPAMPMLVVRVTGGPNHVLPEELRARVSGLGQPHLCESCVAALGEWIKAGAA